MLGNFSYSNPTRLYFGDDAISFLGEELNNYGKKVMLTYGGGSIKKNGIYDEVIKTLKDEGKEVFEDPGVMSNPTVQKLYEGCRIAKENDVDLILAVGGGSTIDYAKAVSVSAWCEENPWDKYYLRMEDVDNRIIPVGSILTMVGTGSEMNGGAVITNHEQKKKIGHVFGDNVMPKFSILNPKYTYTVPKYQMVAGIYDIFNHICEQYFSGDDDNTSDYLAEALMKSVIHASRIAVKNPEDYEARSNLMWSATWALNTLIAKGKSTDWEVHMIGQAIGAYTDATHGMTLSAVSLPYYRHIMPYGLHKFVRFAKEVWDIRTEDMSERDAAEAGLAAMESWMKEIGVVLSAKELGVTEDMIDGIADATFLFDGGYKALTRDEENNCSENTSEEASAQVDDTQSKSTEGDKDAGQNVKR
jgi:alcohol dehydrogenase YqhD (iron-dependent ADH family)